MSAIQDWVDTLPAELRILVPSCRRLDAKSLLNALVIISAPVDFTIFVSVFMLHIINLLPLRQVLREWDLIDQIIGPEVDLADLPRVDRNNVVFFSGDHLIIDDSLVLKL